MKLNAISERDAELCFTSRWCPFTRPWACCLWAITICDLIVVDFRRNPTGSTNQYFKTPKTNSSLQWGIELLVNGDGIGEHIKRFTPPDGKYAALAVSDFTVVDFRGNSTGQPTNIAKHSKRVTVFFKKDDYSIANCIFGEESNVVQIYLSN